MATKPTRDAIRKHAEQALAKRAIFPPDPSSPSFEPRQRGYDEELERQLTNSEMYLTRVYELDQAREDNAAQRAAAARADLEAKLMLQYKASVPGTTDAEAKQALPDLLHRHRLTEQERDAEALAVARRRNRL
jgi:hypothetical protein